MYTPLQQAYRYMTRHSPTYTHTPTQAHSTHTHTDISTHPGPPECLFWGIGRGAKEIFWTPPNQIKWSLTKHSVEQGREAQTGGIRNKRIPTTQRHLDPVSDSEWASSSPEYQGWNSRVPYRREHPNYYPEKPGWDRCNLLLLNMPAFRKLHMVTNSLSLSCLSRIWKCIKKKKNALQTKDVSSMPLTSTIFRKVTLVLIQNSFILTLYTILNIHEIWFLSLWTTISNHLEITKWIRARLW